MHTHSVLFQKTAELVPLIFDLCPHFPKLDRFTLGKRLEDTIMDMLMSVAMVETVLKPLRARELSLFIGKAHALIPLVYFCFKRGTINETNFNRITELLREVARIAHGWLKTLQ